MFQKITYGIILIIAFCSFSCVYTGLSDDLSYCKYVDVRTLKDKLLSIIATGEIGASAPIANTIITERNTEDEENEEDE